MNFHWQWISRAFDSQPSDAVGRGAAAAPPGRSLRLLRPLRLLRLLRPLRPPEIRLPFQYNGPTATSYTNEGGNK